MRKFVVASISIAALLSGCTEPGQTTAIGATAGGVLGAGLGAIVGNQTGDPGTGLVIGGLAGAGAGAAVGNALEGQQVAIRQQDEAIERQQKTIQAQNAELKELRRSAGDTGRSLSRGSASASTGKARYSWSSSREEALARSRSEALAKSSRGGNASSGDSFSRSKPTSRISPETAPARSFRSPVIGASDRGSLHAKTAAAERDALLLKESDLDSGVERRLSKAEAAIDRHDAAVAKGSSALQERTIGIREEAVADDGSAEASGAATLSGDSPSTVECQQAVEEEANASRATEPSQQLFHLRRALRLCPEDARFHVALGKTYASMKRDEDASFEFREALRIDSSYAPALQALEELNKKMQDSNQH